MSQQAMQQALRRLLWLIDNEAPVESISRSSWVNNWNVAVGQARASLGAVIADRAQRQAVPQGWKLVPIEPTEEMLVAARRHRPHPNVRGPDHWDSANAAVYRYLLSASPTPPASTEAQPPTAEPAGTFTPPAIGQPWPGIDGVYAGVSRGEDGEPDGHLVLLNAQPEADMSWGAAVEWAQGLGDGARLPTRFESALLYANVRDKLDTGHWHWTGAQYSGRNAWVQTFGDGRQLVTGKTAELRARAVRRLNAQSFNPNGGQAQNTDGVGAIGWPNLKEGK